MLPRALGKDQLDVCPRCGGTGFLMPDLPLGHPDFGRPVPCNCREEERRARRLHALQHTGSFRAITHLTFETFTPEPTRLSPDQAATLHWAYETLARAYNTCRMFAEEPEGWILLTGAYGCGKTHLAAAIANRRLALGEPVVFMTAPDLLDHLRSAFGPQSEITYDDLFDRLREAPLLILDDLGAHSGTPWAQEKFFQLLNHRYNAQLPTVITTNEDLEDLDPRLSSRLQDVELVNHVAILAPDYRKGDQIGASELSTLNLHRDQKFATFDAQRTDIKATERDNLREVYAACEAYVQEPHGWLVLIGANGCGKTHLAAAIANAFMERTRADVMFVTTPDLLDYLRAAFSPQANSSYDRRFDEVKRARLLVLDDLGTESATAWAREKLFQLLNYRYDALLPTVITTSADPKQIEPWLRNRMLDVSRCQYAAIVAPGYRGSRSQQEAREAKAQKRR